MAIDMTQFHQMFFEESFEGLGVMESGLLQLAAGTANDSAVDTVFRAVHSIKGASATFGFHDIATFSHDMETLLDEMRQGRRQATAETVQALLHSVDQLQQMLGARRDMQPLDGARESVEQRMLQEILPSDPPAQPERDVDADPKQAEQAVWHILFRPLRHMMRTGSDPLRLLRELAGLGQLSVSTDSSRLPELAQLDPEQCYLHWDLQLRGAVDRSAIEDLFDWVEDDCDLCIKALDHQQPAAVLSGAGMAVDTGAGQQPGGAGVSVDDAIARQEVIAGRPDIRHSDKESGRTVISGSIRVDLVKIDALVDSVGELAITQSMLSLMGEDLHAGRLDRLQQSLAQLERQTRDLQESVMKIRMLPIGFTFNRFERLVHDLSVKLGKQIELEINGASTELDKSVIEQLADPLVHLVRNSADHGIEKPTQRRIAGKPASGKLQLNAFHQEGRVVVEVRDDGRGLDREAILSKAIANGLVDGRRQLTDQQVLDLVLRPGFSTAPEISDLSGRGVGLDVVARNIHALGGDIEIESEPGTGTAIVLRLPLTLAVLDGQILSVGSESYIVPLVSIVLSMRPGPDRVKRLAGRTESFRLNDDDLPLIRLYEIFGIDQPVARDPDEGLLVVVEAEGRRCGLLVDDLAAQQQLVIKSLEANYRPVDGVSAATILADGSVALILDVPWITRLAAQSMSPPPTTEDVLLRQPGWQ